MANGNLFASRESEKADAWCYGINCCAAGRQCGNAVACLSIDRGNMYIQEILQSPFY